MVQWYARGASCLGIRGHCQRTERHPVIPAAEGPYRWPALHAPRDLQRSLDRIGAGRPCKLDSVLQAFWLEHISFQRLKERALSGRVHVQGVQDMVVSRYSSTRCLMNGLLWP